jgi:hypothetical protein
MENTYSPARAQSMGFSPETKKLKVLVLDWKILNRGHFPRNSFVIRRDLATRWM